MVNEELFDIYINRKATIITHSTEQYQVLRNYVISKELEPNDLSEDITSCTIYNAYNYRHNGKMSYGTAGDCYRDLGYEFIDFEDVFEGGEVSKELDIFDYLK